MKTIILFFGFSKLKKKVPSKVKCPNCGKYVYINTVCPQCKTQN